MRSGPVDLPRPITEDDYKWVLAGIDYLLEVDATTREQRSRLVALRRRVSERTRRGAAWLPRSARRAD